MNFFASIPNYNNSLKIPKSVQTGFKTVHFFSEKLAVLLAAKIFTTPIKFKTPKRELPMLEASQKSYLAIPAINEKIHVLSYGYSDKKVLIAHGWAGRSTQLFMIANKLLEHGFMVISFDGPAHGKSSGKQSNLIEYVAAVDELYKSYGPFYAGIGHSFGGMALLNAQSQCNLFKKVITIGSGDKVSDILVNFGINLGLDKNFGKKLQDFLEEKWKLKVDEYASSNASKNIKVPVLVLHDSFDGDVSVNAAINIRKKLTKGYLRISSKLGHTKILRDKETIEKIIEFLK